ncbi:MULTISPECIES: formate dehydrogenase accessory protein FdhE [unclassified Pseudomonas]|uniref:formate dehydrogenase accessory protein FdhE n=1 Tax=unclassified Pseudomonas TaxID=196821 RepID=UPI000C88E007|nr:MULTISPECIES: formate dehydrogenase accessory protein FdhE [unclassified Pseudomonas]PMZ93494.1 formate dehydrogenase accessory protein FdhE [Pseudomonas sp. FW305-42]PNA20965.1 formate dehydrogenase accessory protein FdhE [Pseudomonas sp. MPR-R1B]PNB22361.1 formate dehydrogenase accessory protein FdhE [Pseudomonas sp. DP16D-E2]PNB41418.1 formate dehydrogenase accessory protein FdhE [Pseudomonas sp. FW305-17]PNB57159.1 formate dehydrogenase accessory protein FdhE [Pseudomonas sp. GW531-E2]
MSTILEPGQIEASAVMPPFLHLPPANLFAVRAARLEHLAEGNALGEYLHLVARLCRIQQQLVDNPPGGLPVAEERQRLCISHGLPPLAADGLVREGQWLVWLQALLDHFEPAPEGPLAAALGSLRESGDEQRKGWAIALLGGQYDAVPTALVPFLGAALQAAWSSWLLTLPEPELKPAGSLAQCPACGSPAMAGVVRNRGKHNGLRYLACSLCACEWHVVRVKCVYCESSKGLRYSSLEDDRHAPGKAPLRAECCPGCQGYLKQSYLENDAAAEPLADDLASLALDMRLDEEGFHRLAPNLLLAPGSG